jgi:diguanylate cyclase (GGDEF)-like protein
LIRIGDVWNALSASIAVLDADGIVVAVNDAWKRFASANGAADASFYVGTSYVAACEAAAAHGDASAKAALDAVRAALVGEVQEIAIEYPCDSPGEERWFVLRVTRLAGHEGVVVAHENITARKRAEHELEAASRELEEALARERVRANVDGLTGAANRRHFYELAEQELAVAKRYRQPMSVILFDLDHFKQINDSLGHQGGDEMLQRVARMARAHLRNADVFARYGGEEFIVLLPQTSATPAQIVAERMREDMTAASVTISCGVAELMSPDDTLDEIVRRADQALYTAKRQGRNRTVLFQPATI